MKKIIDKFKENLGFKIAVGVLSFLMTNVVPLNNEPIVKEKENYTTELSFEKKFLEMKNIYLDNDLTY